MKFSTSIIFSGLIFWLLSFAMDGVLLSGQGLDGVLLFFLIPHAAVLLLLSLVPHDYDLKLTADSGIVLSGLSTLLLPMSGDFALVFLVLCGIGAAPVMIRLGVLLKSSPDYLKHVVAGLIAGNALTLLAQSLPLGYWMYILAAAGVSLSLGHQARSVRQSLQPILIYQPIIFVLYIIAGIMYGFLAPAYLAGDPLPGLDLFFYVVAVFLGWYFFAGEIKWLLYLAVSFAILSQPALYEINPLFFTTGLFFTQSSMGFADFFVLAMALRHSDPGRALGLSSGTLCLGIAAGAAASMTQLDVIALVAVVGNLGLAACILMLMVISGKSRPFDRGVDAADNEGMQVKEDASDRDEPGRIESEQKNELADEQLSHEEQVLSPGLELPREITDSLSPREFEVLNLVMIKGRLYRETAQELGISESTVKTYMKRIYIKTGVGTRKDLDILCRSKQTGN